MSDIQAYQTAEGLSDEEMAARLSDLLDRPISVQGYKIVKGRKSAPGEWLNALSIVPRDESAVDRPPPADDDPQPPAHRAVMDALPFEPQSVQLQIEMAYKLAGKGVAMVMHEPKVAYVWGMAAPDIAQAYIAWARENRTVAHYLGMLTLGGAAGNLVLLHGSLLVATLIASGQVGAPGFVPPTMRTAQETDLINETEDEHDDSTTEPTQPRDLFS